MSEVTDLSAYKAAKTPHTCGPVMCLQCKHEWTGVIPCGTTQVTCPECHTLKGVRAGLIYPKGYIVWVCDCGNDLFFLDKDRNSLCPICGVRQITP